jgi:hypothetical protein
MRPLFCNGNAGVSCETLPRLCMIFEAVGTGITQTNALSFCFAERFEARPGMHRKRVGSQRLRVAVVDGVP